MNLTTLLHFSRNRHPIVILALRFARFWKNQRKQSAKRERNNVRKPLKNAVSEMKWVIFDPIKKTSKCRNIPKPSKNIVPERTRAKQPKHSKNVQTLHFSMNFNDFVAAKTKTTQIPREL